jgi:hypothetical protein
MCVTPVAGLQAWIVNHVGADFLDVAGRHLVAFLSYS